MPDQNQTNPWLTALPWGLGGLQTVGDFITNWMGTKKRRSLLDEVYPQVSQNIDRNAEHAASRTRTAANQSGLASGIGPGSGLTQISANAAAPVYQKAASDKTDLWGNLKMQDWQAEQERRAAKQKMWGDLFGDVTGAGMGALKANAQQKYLKMLEDWLGMGGGGAGSGTPSNFDMFGQA